jgi:hypothetical protein
MRLDPARRPAILTRLAVFSLCMFVAVDALAQAAPGGAYPSNGQAQYAQQYPQQQQQYPQQQQQYPQQQYPQQQPYPQQPYPQAPYGAAPGYGPAPGYPQPVAAGASEPLVSSVDGLIQLGIGTALFQHVGGALSPDSGPSISQSNTSWGIAKNPTTLEGGYGFLPNLVVGGLLQFGGNSAATPKTSSFALAIGPKADYMFMPNSKLNPFAGVMLGIAYSSSSIGSALASQSQTDFIFMARGGMRWFMFDSVSLDPTLVIGGALGSATQTVNSLVGNLSSSSFQVAFTLGLSVWLK